MATPEENQLPALKSSATNSDNEKLEAQGNEPESEEDNLSKSQVILLMLSLSVCSPFSDHTDARLMT